MKKILLITSLLLLSMINLACTGADGQDGADGRDWCITLGFWSTGPVLYDWPCVNNAARTISESQSYITEYTKFTNSGILDNNSNQGVLMDFHLLDNMIDNQSGNDDPDLMTRHGSLGKYSYKISYKRIN